jgi:hypothetical protein
VLDARNLTNELTADDEGSAWLQSGQLASDAVFNCLIASAKKGAQQDQTYAGCGESVSHVRRPSNAKAQLRANT